MIALLLPPTPSPPQFFFSFFDFMLLERFPILRYQRLFEEGRVEKFISSNPQLPITNKCIFE